LEKLYVALVESSSGPFETLIDTPLYKNFGDVKGLK